MFGIKILQVAKISLLEIRAAPPPSAAALEPSARQRRSAGMERRSARAYCGPVPQRSRPAPQRSVQFQPSFCPILFDVFEAYKSCT